MSYFKGKEKESKGADKEARAECVAEAFVEITPLLKPHYEYLPRVYSDALDVLSPHDYFELTRWMYFRWRQIAYGKEGVDQSKLFRELNNITDKRLKTYEVMQRFNLEKPIFTGDLFKKGKTETGESTEYQQRDFWDES